jgi:YesN/AraC family two-component response regulator
MNLNANFEPLDGNFIVEYNDEPATGNILYEFHDVCEIIFYIKANIVIFIKDVQYNVKDGDIVFLDEYDIHKILYTHNTQYVRYTIDFRKSYVQDVLNVLNIGNLFNTLFLNNNRKLSPNLKKHIAIEQLFRDLLNTSKKIAFGKNPFIEVTFKFLLIQLLMHLVDLAAKNISSYNFGKKNQQVFNIINFVDMNYTSSLPLELLEESFLLSKSYMCRIFKEITSFTISEYIQYRRIIEAQKMLKETSNSIVDICYGCGFTNLRHFYRVFIKITNVSPLKFRKANRNI